MHVPSFVRRLAPLAALAAIYLIWGSTFLAIRVGIASLPPFMLCALRFVVAGALLYAWARLRGAAAPTLGQWASVAGVAAVMMVGAQGTVVWAEQHVSSGAAATLFAAMPAWMSLFEWAAGGPRPGWRVAGGMLAGTVGVGVLVLQTGDGGGSMAASVAVVAAAGAWALGSLLSRRAALPANGVLSLGAQLLVASVMVGAWSLASGEAAGFDVGQVSGQALAAVLYLALAGSIVAFGCYLWLLKVMAPSVVATYAYVTPAVAVGLGWALGGEAVSAHFLQGAALILAGVGMILAGRSRGARGTSPRPALWRRAGAGRSCDRLVQFLRT